MRRRCAGTGAHRYRCTGGTGGTGVVNHTMSAADEDSTLIVGGGLAGLAAAEWLTMHGRRSVVLEANAVVGGRVRQGTLNDSAATIVELGGEFFHGDTSTSKQTADAIGLLTERVFTAAHGDGGPDEEPAPDGGVALYFTADGQCIPFDSEDRGFCRLNDALEKLRNLTQCPEVDARSVRQFLTDEGVPHRFVELAAASYSNTLGVGDALGALPICGVSRLERLWSAADGDGDYRVANRSGETDTAGRALSLASFTHALAAGSEVLTHWPVVKLEVSAGPGGRTSVRATCADGRHMCGTAAIIAVPVTILQRGAIRFDPPLPAEKLGAIGAIRMMNAVKVLLLFREAPVAVSGAPPEALVRGPLLHSLISAGPPGRIVPEIWFKRYADGRWLASGFATGAYADALAALGEDGASEIMLQQLARSLPEASLDALASQLVSRRLMDWSAEEYVGGGYSAPSFFEGERHRAIYRRTECGGSLSFCGEATEDACMTMSAAIESGRRAAAEVFEAQPSRPGQFTQSQSARPGPISRL